VLEATVRAQVEDRLRTSSAVDQREHESLERFLIEFDRLHRPFDEHAAAVHVTGSAIVTGPRGVLLHRHKRLGIWLQPGGHIDDGETPWDAALREAGEETGLPMRFAHSPPSSFPPSSFPPPSSRSSSPPLVHVDVHPGPRGHTHLDLRYLIDGGHADPQPPVGESQVIAWFGWDDAIAIADPGLRGALEALRPGQG
jgi:8-oxo-dGTP pyrophosphatase MutT (NUDIX family)